MAIFTTVRDEIADKASKYKTLRMEYDAFVNGDIEYRARLNPEYIRAKYDFTDALHTYPAIDEQWHAAIDAEPARNRLPMPPIMPDFSLVPSTHVTGYRLPLHLDDNIAFNRYLYTQLLCNKEFRYVTDPEQCMYFYLDFHNICFTRSWWQRG